MFTEINMNKDNLKQNFYVRKVLSFVKKNTFSIVIIVLCILIVFNLVIYNKGLNNVNPKDVFIVSRLCFNSIIIGTLMGFFLALFGEVWYRKKIVNDKNKETAKNYARIFKADIERSIRLFKNKRFELIKISNVTIIENWLQGFGYISTELSKEEIQEFINYYSRINKLIEYENRINQHLEGMQHTTLKGYPYMKEYKDLIEMFSFEVKSLFKVDISKVREKLNMLCK